MLNNMINLLNRKKLYEYFNDKSAIVMIEFALVLPIILMLITGMIEYSNYSYAKQKLISAANVIVTNVTDLEKLEIHVFKFLSDFANRTIQNYAQSTSYTITDGATGNIGNVNSSLSTVFNVIAAFDVNQGVGTPNYKPYVMFQHTEGDPNTVNTRFNYDRGVTNSPINLAYYNRNSVTQAEINNLPLIQNQQFIIVEAAIQYRPIVSILNVGSLGDIPIHYETSPALPRIGAYKFLPDGTNIQTY